MTSVFLSHSHGDFQLVECFENLLREVTFKGIKVYRSSKSGSIEYGTNWLEWIRERVSTSDISFIILTPRSFKSNWVLWEAGAVSGVIKAQERNSEIARKAIPIKFGLPSAFELGPFSNTEVVDGLDPEQVRALIKQVLQDLQNAGVIDHDLVYESVENLSGLVHAFVESAESTLKDLPIYQKFDLVQGWVSRLDVELNRENPDYVVAAARWINIAFLGSGRASDKSTSIDFRLHARLAEGFVKLKRWHDARDQLSLAHQLSPRDIMILRELGRAEIELNNQSEKAKSYVDKILELDPDAFKADPETLNLAVRLSINDKNWAKALEYLREATNLSENDAYVKNMLAIATLRVHGIESALPVFRELEKLELRKEGLGIWSIGNLANVALAEGDSKKASEYLERLKNTKEAAFHRQSISRYFDDIIDRVPEFDYDWRKVWPESRPRGI